MTHRTRLSSDRSGKFTLLNLLVLAELLALPLLALRHLTIDWRLAVAYAGTINLLCFGLYATDKRRAVAGEWRVPEQYGFHVNTNCR
jgi:hypothetical protein